MEESYNGFVLPTIGTMLMALNMTQSGSFRKIFSWVGFVGNILMIFYMVLVTFLPDAGKFALMLAMPGGLLIMAWMVSFTISFFKLAAK